MKFTIDKEVDYIPDVYGNGDLPEEDQVVVTIKVPTASETSLIAGSRVGDISQKDLIQSVGRLVKKIVNLEVNGKAITDGKELVLCEGMYIFALNIGTHIIGLVSDIEQDPT